MTTSVVFDDFVRVRWGDLEPAARLVVLDPEVAREVTAGALARLGAEWSSTTEEGRPVERARRLVLAGALARAAPPVGLRLRRPSRAPPPTHTGAEDDDPLPWEVEVDSADPVVAPIVEHLRRLDPLDRTLLAGQQVWDLHPDEVARVLDLPVVVMRERDRALRADLARTHAAALPGHLGPSTPWGFDADLARAVDVVLHGPTDPPDPPDPAALVGVRARRVRRRTLVLGGAAAVVVAGTGMVVGLPDPVVSTRSGAMPPATDGVWTASSKWPARGPLAGHPSMRTFLSRRGIVADRILWAGDLGTRRVVLVWGRPESGYTLGTTTLVFTGPRGSEPSALEEVDLPNSKTFSYDTIAVALPDGPGRDTTRSLLVLLARPTVLRAAYSPVVRPTAAGDLRRDWTVVPLEFGVATAVLDLPEPAALRVRVATFDGPPVSVSSPFEVVERLTRGQVSAADGVDNFIESVTGIPVSWLRTEVVSDDPVPSGLLDLSLAGGDGQARVVSLRTATPDGAVLRSVVHLEVGGGAVPLELAILVPAVEAEWPRLVQVVDPRPGVSRFLVVHPPVASVQLIGVDDHGLPRSPVVRTRGRRATVVDVVTDWRVGTFRIVLRDARGRTVHDGIPSPGRFLTDG